MADQVIKIKEVLDISDVLNNVRAVQDAISDLKISDTTQASFDKLFSKVEQQAQKASEIMASGFKTKGDVTKYRHALDQVSNAYEEIGRQVQKLANTDLSLKVEATQFKTATEEVKKFKAELDKATKDLEKLKNTDTLKPVSGDGRKAEMKAWKEALKSFESHDLDKANKELDKLGNILNKLIGDKKAFNNLSEEEKNRLRALQDNYKALRTKVDGCAQAENAVVTAGNKLATAQGNLNTVLKNSRTITSQLNTDFQRTVQGERNYVRETEAAAVSTQQLGSELDQFKNKVTYFFGLNNAVHLFQRALRSAYNTVKDLDAVMTETAVVTNFDVGDMWEKLPEYTQRANELGVSIHSAYEAATIFYQQGLKTNEVMAVSNETLKMARIAGLDAATASDRMTNALRGFNMEMDELSAKRVNDVYSKLAAITASNTDEISTAMTKVASLAHNANMEFETTSAFLAQMIETTRESAETAGTALKTVVARFSEVKKLYSKGELTGQDEEGGEIDVNKVSTALRSAGIDLNEYLTGAKGLDDIFIELASKWDSLDKVQQRYIATMAAGSRQQSRFIAMMSNYGRTAELVEAANNANGASNEQYGKTLESLQTKLARLENAWNEFVLGLANSDVIKGAVDMLTNLITAINTLIKAISGKNAGVKMITSFFTAFAAFKMGSKLVGKNNPIAKMFTTISEAGKTKIINSAKSVAELFDGNVVKNLGKRVKGKIDNNAFLNYFTTTENIGTNFKVNDIEQFRSNLLGAREMPIMTDAQSAAVNAAIDTGDIEEVNKVLNQQGIQLQINAQNAEQFGVTTEAVTKKSANGWKIAGAAVTATGAALMVAGDWVKSLGDDYEDLGNIIKIFGGALTVLGTILSVVLPVMAQKGAASISAAISSIPIVGWIAAIIGAFVALGVAIHQFNKGRSFENKLKKANDACKQAADAADEAAKAYENLGKAWDELQDKYSAIDDATVGTQKWRDAIKEANDEVLKLVEAYDGLQVTVGEDGRLLVDESSKNAAAEKLRSAKEMSQAASAGAQLAKARLESDEIEKNWSGHDLTGRSDEWKINGVTYDEDKVKERVVEAYKQGQIHSVEDMRNVVESYLPEEQKNDPNYRSIVNGYKLEGLKEYVKGSNFSETSKTHLNGMISAALTNMNDKEAINFGKNLLGTDVAKKAFEEQLKETTINRDDSSKREEFAKNQGYDSYAEWKEKANDNKEISDVQLNYQLASQRTQKKFNSFTEALEGKVGNLTAEQRKLFAEEAGGALSVEEIERLKNQKDEIYKGLGGNEEFSKLGLSEDDVKNYLENILNQAGTNASIKIAGIGEELIGDLTAGARKSLDENLKSIYTASGQKGYDQITGTINKLTKGLDSDSKKGFMKSLSQIDWASANSVRGLSDLAKAYGLSEDAVDDLEQQIIKLNNAATKVDLKKVTEQIKSLLGLGHKVSTGAQGRSFSKEDYENLINTAGMDAKDFSYNITTGNYEYIGDRIQDVVDAINNQTDKMIDTSQLEKDVASGMAAKELMEKGKPETDADKMAFIRDYVLKAGSNSKISNNMLQAAATQSRAGNYEIADKLIAIIEKESNALPDRQSELDNYAREKDIMKAQTNSGAENAARAIKGNEAALTALKTQFAGSSLPEEIKSKILAGINSGDEDSINKAGSLVDTSTQANALGIKSEELDAYAKALQQVEGLQDAEIDELYRLSLAELNYQKGQQALYDSYDSWSKLIQKNGGIIPDGSIEQGKVFAQLNKDLKQMLNLSEDLPKDFLAATGRADELKKAMKGNKDAIAKLRAEAAKVTFKNFNLNIKKDDATEIENQIDKLAKEMPDLKIGTTLDSTQFGPALMEMVNKAGMSVDQIESLFKGLGWAPQITWKKATVEDVTKTAQGGVIKQPDPNNPGKTIDVPLDGFNEWASTNDVYIPQIGDKTSHVAAKPPKTPAPKTKKKGKGGGGKKSKAKKERWENPYDELYNLQEKINEALRKREALERRYQKLLKQEQSSLSDIRKSYYDQIKQIRTEASLQKELEAGRARQINNIGKETYVDSKGKVKTFDQMGVTKYAKYNFETGEIEMDWAGIQALEGTKNVEKGKAVEAYVSKLEELVKSYEEVRDKLWELEDKIEEYRQAVIDTFLSFEDRVLDAVINKYQKEIDSYQAMSDAIDKVNNEVLSSLREQIDLSRQIRDNTKKEEDISKKENRLAYLRRDTSGANDLEILSLEKELKDAREGYADTLVDQTIDKLQDDADKASEQRQRQIETMQAQLDIAKETGALWQEVYDLMQDAAKSEIFSSDSELAKLLRDGEAFKALSNIGQAKWWEEVGKSFREAIIGRDEAEDKYKTDADNNGTVANTGTSDYLKEIGEMNTQANVTADSYERTDEQNYGAAAAIVMGGTTHGGWGAKNTNWASNLKEKGFDPGVVLDLVDIFNAQKAAWDKEQTALQKKKGKYTKGKNKGKWKYTKKAWTGWKTMGVTDWKKYQMSQFKTGGLADTTGPAWLDGTKTNPELVLNAKDTRNFIALKDILASLMNTQKTKPSASSGDNYFDINIQADIGSDYDVDKLASRIKKIIFEDGQYRNVNTINYLR